MSDWSLTKSNIRRKLVVLKFTLQRGYAWCQLPALALIGAGVLGNYFPNWSLWSLGIAAMAVFLSVGIADRLIGLLQEETNYSVEMSPLLLQGLKGELTSSHIDKKEQEKKEQDEKIQKDLQNDIKKD